MKDNSKLSIDDILRETDDLLKSLDAQSKAAAGQAQEEEDTKAYDPKREEDGDVKAYVPKKKDSEDVKAYVPKSRNVDAEAYPQKPEEDGVRTYSPASRRSAAPRSSGSDSKPAVSDKTRPVSEKTKSVTMEQSAEDGGVKHYFSSNSRNDGYAPVPPQIIERPATIKSKSRFNKTSDLQEIPTIVAVDELERTRMIFAGELWSDSRRNDTVDSDNGYDDSDQIKISGFDDEVNEIPDIDEELAEEELRLRREAKVKTFRLFAKEEVQNDSKSEARHIISKDYSENSDRTGTLEQLYKRKARIQLQTVLTAIMGLLLLLLTLFRESRYLPSFLGSDIGYYASMLALYGLILITNVNTLIRGFNLRRGFNYDSMITVSALLILGHTAALLFYPDLLIEGGAIYPCAATFALILSSLG